MCACKSIIIVVTFFAVVYSDENYRSYGYTPPSQLENYDDVNYPREEETTMKITRSKPDPNYNSFLQFKYNGNPKEEVEVKYVSKCNTSLFLQDIDESPKFGYCFAMSEKLFCGGDKVDKTYRQMLGDSLFKLCFEFMNLNSLQAVTVKQLHHEKAKVEVYCENSIPVTRCQCNNFLIEQERRYQGELNSVKSELTKTSTEFDSCRITKEALLLANDSSRVQLQTRQQHIGQITADLKACEKEKEKEVRDAIATGNQLQNCSLESKNLLTEREQCYSNLTISKKTLHSCINNITDVRQKREQTYNECEATRAELVKKIAESNAEEAAESTSIDMQLSVRQMIKVAAYRGYHDKIRVFAITPDLRSSSYWSKYGHSTSFSPQVPVIPPRPFLADLCKEHCSELRRKNSNRHETQQTFKYTFSDPLSLLNAKRYKTPTGLSLEVSGTVTFWEVKFPIDTDQLHTQLYKSKNTYFVLTREDGKNWQHCICPSYGKDLFSESEDFLDALNENDRSLASGVSREKKPEDPTAYMLHQPATTTKRPSYSQRQNYHPQQDIRQRQQVPYYAQRRQYGRPGGYSNYPG